MLVERYVFHADLGEQGARRLLAWCRSQGVDSFTFTVIGSPPDLERDAAAIEASLEPYSLPTTRVRTIPDGEPGSQWTRVSVLWELNDTTEPILLACFPRGLLSHIVTDPSVARPLKSWCEDPILFRGDELMLGIVSHESEGVLRIHAREQLALDQSEIPYRLHGEWVGY
jgi:hypothetical protein